MQVEQKEISSTKTPARRWTPEEAEIEIEHAYQQWIKATEWHAEQKEKSFRRKTFTKKHIPKTPEEDKAEEQKWIADEPKRRRKEERETIREQILERRVDREFERTGIPPRSP